MLKIGVVGAGHLGKIHLSQIKQAKGLELVGFYDANEAIRKEVASTYHVHAFDSYEQLLENVDAVDIVTPTVSHYEVAKQALQNTKHVFIEKPISSTIEEAEAISRLVTEAGVIAQVGHVERFNPAFLALQNVDIKPQFIEIHRLAQWNPRGGDVSVVHDLMIHDIDVVLHLVQSELKRVSANGVAVITSTPDIANARLEFNNGCVVNLTASRISMKNMRKMRIFQPNSYITVDFLDKTVQLFNLSEEQESHTTMSLEIEGKKKYINLAIPQIPEINAIRYELETFADAVLNNSEPKVPIYDAVKSMRVAYEILDKINPLTNPQN